MEWTMSIHGSLFTYYDDEKFGPELVSIRTLLHELANKHNVNPRMYEDIMDKLVYVLEGADEVQIEKQYKPEDIIKELSKSKVGRDIPRLSARNCTLELSDDQIRGQVELISKQLNQLSQSMSNDRYSGGQTSTRSA
jgi:hypothetical protein